MQNIIDFAKIVYSFLSREADAKRNIVTYLKAYLRPEILKNIKINNILDSIAKRISSNTDKELFLEDIVDNFIDDKKGEDIRALLTSKAKKIIDVDHETASKIIGGSTERLSDVEKEGLKKGLKDFTSIASKYLVSYLNNKYKVWVAEHSKTERILDEAIEPFEEPDLDTGIPLDKTNIEEPLFDDVKENNWEEGLIKDVVDLINRKAPKEKILIYKKILKDMFLAKSPKTFPQIVKETGLSIGSLHKYKGELVRMLSEFLTAQGLGGRFLEDGGMARKNIDIPKYVEHLKDKKNAVDFKDFADNQFSSKTSDLTIQVVYLLGEGKTVSEAVTGSGASLSNVKKIKSLYFDKWYKKWYEEKVAEIRKSASNLFVKAAMGKTGKRVVIPMEKKKTVEEEPTVGDIVPAHERMVDKAIEKHDIIAHIFFKANYDNLDVIAGRKDPEKDPIDFAYKKYEASFFTEKQFGKNNRIVDYFFSQKLSDKGDFEGRGESTLKLDNKKVSSKNMLKKKLDDYVENHMKPEGILPYGKALSKKTRNILFPVGYENIVRNKKYSGVRQFFEKYRGLLIEDTSYSTRKKIIEDKELRKQIPVGEKERLKGKIFDLKDELGDLKNEKPRNNARIKELDGHIKELEKYIKGKGDGDVKEINEIIDSEMDILNQLDKLKNKSAKIIYAAVFPFPESDAVVKLVHLAEKYNISKNINGWLLPVELLALSKIVKARVKIGLDKQLKEIKKSKGKKEEKEEKTHIARALAREEINNASAAFKAFPGDLKKRRNSFFSYHKKDYDSYALKRNMGWVDSEPEVNRILSKIQEELRVEVTELGKTQLKKKPVNIKMLDKSKYNSLEAFLEQALDGLNTIAERFAVASLQKEDINPAMSEKIESEIAKSDTQLKAIKKEIENFSGEDANNKQVDELKKQLPKFFADIQKMEKKLNRGKEIPAFTIAEVLMDKITYFSGLYSFLSRILWFGDSTYVQADTDTDIATLDQARKKIVSLINAISKKPIHANDTIKSGLSSARLLLKDFIKKYDSSDSVFHRFDMKLPSVKSSNRKSFPYLTAIDKKDYEEARIKMVFPADELGDAKDIITQIKKDSNPEISALGDKAQKEFNSMLKNVTEAYSKGFDKSMINALADKEKIPFNKASLRLKKIQDSLARSALSEFILNWQEVKEPFGHTKDERSGLGNKPSEEYDVMGAFVERQLPDIFGLMPLEEGPPKEPKRGVPTPKAIREKIEDEFTRDKPSEMEEKYDFFVDSGGTSGGGGGKSKGRSKPIKPPVANALLETMKDDFVKMFKRAEPQRIVLTVLAQYTSRLRSIIKNLKEDEYLDPGDVIDGFVSLLKRLQYLITTLNVAPSATAYRLPPVGAPKFSGKPDIEINTSKEAKEVFDKILQIYKTINKFIAPDQVGIPPANISNLRKEKRYLPSGLVDWYQHLEKTEKQKKTADNCPLQYRVMQRFAMISPTEKEITILS